MSMEESQRAVLKGAMKIWEHKEDPDRHLKIVGGVVSVDGQDYYPVSHGYMTGHGFQASGDPAMKRTEEFYANWEPYKPKPEFPVGSFLTDKKTKTHIFFVADEEIVYRMDASNTTMSYNQGLEFYLSMYGDLVPVKSPIGSGDLIINVAE